MEEAVHFALLARHTGGDGMKLYLTRATDEGEVYATVRKPAKSNRDYRALAQRADVLFIFCRAQFSRTTGIKLKPGECRQVLDIKLGEPL